MSVVRSAESVCIGHPDKLCDLVADTILDDILDRDPAARVVVEVMASGRRIIVAGEITTTVKPRLRASTRVALRKAGVQPEPVPHLRVGTPPVDGYQRRGHHLPGSPCW